VVFLVYESDIQKSRKNLTISETLYRQNKSNGIGGKMNEKTNSLYSALFAIQQEITNVKKDAKNPYHNNTYATLEAVLDAVKPLLIKHKILLVQKCEGLKLSTCLIHVDTGEEINSVLDLINTKDMQQLCGSVTYSRRYTLTSILGIGAEDDDGNTAVGLLKNTKRDSTKNYAPTHEPSTSTKYPTFGYCGQCFAPMYLSKKGTSIYCSNYKDKSIEHDSAQYTGQPKLPDEIDTYDKWIKYKSQPVVKSTKDIDFIGAY